ncbi:MAG: hypothetical protein HY901_03625 [Deltaproteobacteria bacterium]|nr:hypothetical protein [Deltaproteobacteria bacterium]
MRALPLFALALLIPCALLPAGGCGGSDQPAGPDAGATEQQMVDYFGLQTGRCFEYTSADTLQQSPDLGIVVESIDTKSFAVPTRVISYSTGGVAMRDYVAFQDNALVLYKREFPGGKSYIYDPPMKRLELPVLPSSVLNATSAVTIRDGAGRVLADKEAHSLRVDVYALADVALPIATTVSATKISFAETLADGNTKAGRSEVRTFMPGTGDKASVDGLVRIDFNFNLDETSQNVVYKLQKIRDLGDNPATATPPCGGTP